MPRSLALALVLVFAVSSNVRADAPDRTDGDPIPAVDLARERDASVDRGFLMTHAETIGEDRWTINSYELFLLGLTYGVSDRFQLSFTTSLPVVADFPLLLSLAGKWAFYRDRNTVMAARVLIAWATQLSGGDESVGVFMGSFFVDNYLDDAGRFALHGGITIGGAFGTGFDSGGITVADGALLGLELGVTLGVAEIVKLYIEAEIPAATSHGEFEFAPVVLLNYGVRFHSGTIAGDIGFIRPVGDTDSDFILGFPFVAFSARFGGEP